MKVAFISVYGISCGISTYNENLCHELGKLCDLHIFAENGGPLIEGVTRCWNRGDHFHWKLIESIDSFKPDLILFSHEYGFFPRAYQFTTLVSYFKWRKYRVATIFHSVYRHLDKTVQEVVSPHIIVHSEGGRNCLISKGIEKKAISVIPHGSSFLADGQILLPHLWDCWSAPTIFQPGFLFDYKGHLRMLDVVASLKKKYEHVQYIVQGSENPNCIEEHNRVYADIMERAEVLNLLPNISINRGFASMEVLLSYIRTVSCVVLPYRDGGDHSVFATSGMARIVLGTTTPLIVTDVPLFDDIKNKGVSFTATTNEEIEKKVLDIFEGSCDTLLINKAREAFLKETSWANAAQTIINL